MAEALLDLEPGRISPSSQENSYELGNPNLPIHDHRQEIVDAICNNSVVILAGPTGSGKTTQVPQFGREMKNESGEPLFDEITVSQPRIVAARTVSERVREEASSSDNRHAVGYYTSKERTEEPQRIQDIALLTDGKAAAQLLYEGADVDSSKKRLLIIDEVHEWSLNIEQLVAIAHEKTNPRSELYDKNLTVVIMSATMDCKRLQKYFEDVNPPLVEVSVPTYKVTKTMTSKPAALVALDKANETDGKVLAFFASVRGISEASELISAKQDEMKNGDPTIPVIPLHAQQNAEEQSKAFLPYPGGSIIGTTNVAETSLTVPDATTVVDSGEVYEDRVRYDFLAQSSDGLYLTNASRANINQRAGRVGRTAPGEYILASPGGLAPFVPYERRTDYAVPAMQRSRLDGLLLQLSATGFLVEDFKFFHNPPEKAIHSAKNRLIVLGALDSEGSITERGKQMDALPLDPELACMVVFAREKGYSVDVMRNVVDIVSIMQTGGILKRSPKEQKWLSLLEKDKDDEVKEKDSDFFAQLEAYVELTSKDASKWEQYDIHAHSVGQVDENRESLLKRLDLDPTPVVKVDQKDRQQVLNCINAGQLNQVWRRNGEEWILATDNSEHFLLAEASIVSRLGEFATGTLFTLGVGGGRTYNTIQNVNMTTLESLGIVAEHLLVESESTNSRRYSESRQELVAIIERKLGSLVVDSYEQVVEVEHGTNEAELYSHNQNILSFEEWQDKNPAERDYTSAELQSMIEEPKPHLYGYDPITNQPLYAWPGAKGWVTSEAAADKSLRARLKRLENAPIDADNRAQKEKADEIRRQLTPHKRSSVEVRNFLNSRKGSDLVEWNQRGEELLNNLSS